MNMQILGCHYPSKLASQVQKLGKNIGDSYKQQRDGKLSRYFVKASDAATAKIRRTDAPTSRSTVEDDHPAPVNYDSLGNDSKQNLKTKKRKKQNSDMCQTDLDVVQVEQKIKKKKKAKIPMLDPNCDEKQSQKIIEDVNKTSKNDVHNPEHKEKKMKKNKSSSTECNENDIDCVEVVARPKGLVIPLTKKSKKTKKLNTVNGDSFNIPSTEINEPMERKRKRKAKLEEEFEDPSKSAVEVESPSLESKKVKKKKRKLEIEKDEH
ncbi:protein FAM133-like [Hyalella azteca]|uniref:Protein FAM133-like n=1 Tax=Hyalella azteca TaxID=294128 RepID=A0A8B7N5F1_HYAAZ|nr:protein FAM133-like [Hyalella azteca]